MTTWGFIGSGNIGSTVARLAVGAGHDVVLSNSRGTGDARRPRRRARPARPRGNRRRRRPAPGDIVVVTIPLKAYRDVPVEPLAGKVVIDTKNYYPQRDGQIAELDDESTTTSELLQAHLPDAQVVKAFNNIFVQHLAALARPARRRRPQRARHRRRRRRGQGRSCGCPRRDRLRHRRPRPARRGLAHPARHRRPTARCTPSTRRRGAGSPPGACGRRRGAGVGGAATYCLIRHLGGSRGVTWPGPAELNRAARRGRPARRPLRTGRSGPRGRRRASSERVHPVPFHQGDDVIDPPVRRARKGSADSVPIMPLRLYTFRIAVGFLGLSPTRSSIRRLASPTRSGW